MNDIRTAKVAQWNDERGFGFLESDSDRVFVHIGYFVRLHRRPQDGDRVRYRLGEDKTGRPLATDVEFVRDGGRITPLSIAILASLIVLPFLALLSIGTIWQIIVVYAVSISIISFVAYVADKQRARKGIWRTTETALHLLDIAGGWPGAYLAQRWVRHKCSKEDYQLRFWTIVLIYQLVSIDFLTGCHFLGWISYVIDKIIYGIQTWL